jgi:hypothetical protein
MSKQYYATNYDNAVILTAVEADGWSIKASEKITDGEPNSYELRRTPDASTFVGFYPGTFGPPMFDMRNASEDDCDLIDQFDCVGENTYFASLEDEMTEVTVKLINIVYDTIDGDGIDHRDSLTADDIPPERVLTVEVSVLYAEDEDHLSEIAMDAVDGDWLIESCDLEILEDADNEQDA